MAKLLHINGIATRRNMSALYITGDKAQNNFVVLKPYIDFEEQIQNKSKLLHNIKARKLNIDLNKIEKRWNFYKTIDEQKQILDLTRSEIGKCIGKLKEAPEINKNDINKLILHSKLVKDDLKNVREYLYGLEENASLGVLNLPNVLHPKTPLDSEIVIYQHLEESIAISKNHLDIGTEKNLIEYQNPTLYFLKSDASLFDFAVTTYFQNCLLNSFQQFSNADFARSVIVEGCDGDYLNRSNIFSLEGSHIASHDLSKLHLVGGASLCSFMAYFAKHLLQQSQLPLKLFTCGRSYKPCLESKPKDLFNLSQESAVQVFTICEDDLATADQLLDELAKQMLDIYKPLGYHFRVIYVAAHRLEPSESLRMSIEMFSNHLQQYIEVGNLSLYDNYLSKRLLVTYDIKNERKFPKIIAGHLLNVQKFLGCALENNSVAMSPLLPDLLKQLCI